MDRATVTRSALGLTPRRSLALLALAVGAVGMAAPSASETTPRGRGAASPVQATDVPPGTSAAPDGAQPWAQQGAERVVSLLPAAMQILLEIGAGDRLVGRLATDRDPAIVALPSAGDVLAPNAEVIAALRPDLLIVWVGTALGPLTEMLDRRGARVERLAIDRLGDVPPAIRTVARWVGQGARGDSVAAAFERSIAEARALGRVSANTGGGRPSVLWVVSAEPILVAGPGSFLSDLIEVAGGVNAAERTRAPWPRLGVEAVVGLDPDVLVWPDGADMFPAAELTSRAGWQTLSAVSSGRVLAVDADSFHDAGPHLARAALELTRGLAEMSAPR